MCIVHSGAIAVSLSRRLRKAVGRLVNHTD
jgi:hypothetical protein